MIFSVSGDPPGAVSVRSSCCLVLPGWGMQSGPCHESQLFPLHLWVSPLSQGCSAPGTVGAPTARPGGARLCGSRCFYPIISCLEKFGVSAGIPRWVNKALPTSPPKSLSPRSPRESMIWSTPVSLEVCSRCMGRRA